MKGKRILRNMVVLSGGGRILVVDDDTAVARSLELIFITRSYTVRVAHSAEEAIETIAVWRPEVAVVDVMLPHMNGIELGAVLRDNYPDCKVVLVSGHPGTEELLETARREGHSFEILPKPLHPTHILDIVAELMPKISGDA
jgi:DNA-binding NtrC family response regulator